MDSKRNGNFTSSEIYKLLTNGRAAGTLGAPCLDYIKEKQMERRLGRQLTDENLARALSWGKLVERMAFENLGTNYQLCSADTIIHPQYNYWCGTPDRSEEHTSELQSH